MKTYLKILEAMLCLLAVSFTARAQVPEGYYGVVANTSTANHSVGTGTNAFYIDGTGNYDGVSYGAGNDYFSGPSFAAGDQEISGTVAPLFSTLQFTNGSTSKLIVSNTAGLSVAVLLQLNNGITSTTATAAGAIRLLAGASIAGTSFGATSYVDGYLSKAGASSFTYPLGNAGIYSPTTLSNPAGTSIAYIASSPGYTHAFATQSGALQLATVSQKEYYSISSVNGTAPAGSAITIPFTNFSGGYTTDPTTLTVAGWDGSSWTNLSGSGSNTTTASTVTVTLVPSLGGYTKFALASTAVANPLPLTFSSFTGSNLNCSALLKWVTTTEISFSYFSIEASRDGNTFKEVARVASQNSDVGGSYSTSTTLAAGNNYYRVLAMDLSGRNVVNTSIVSIKSTCSDNIALGVYPNPATENVTVFGLTGNSSLTVVNGNGQEMAKLISTKFAQLVPVSNYPSGIYLIRIVNEDGIVHTVRFIKK